MRIPAACFEDLVVWQKAHQFVLAVYRLTRTFPRSEVGHSEYGSLNFGISDHSGF